MTFETRLLPILRPLVKHKGTRVILGFFAILPHILFWILAASHVFHWWNTPWSLVIDRALFQALLVLSALATLFYGSLSILFWRWYWHNPPEQKRTKSHLIVTYSLLPCIHVAVAFWAYDTIRSTPSLPLFYGIFTLGILYDLIIWVMGTLTTLRKHKSRPAS